MRRSRSRTATTDWRWNGTGKTFVSPRTATAGSAMANFKTARGDGFFQSVFGLLTNMRAKFTLRDGVERRVYLIVLTVNLKLVAAIGEESHPASEVEAIRYMPNRPTEADTLN